MAGISRLRLLELSRCRNLKTIAPGIISNQKGLEELIVEDFDNWEAADEERERKNASLSEFEHLSTMSRLKIKIKDSRVAVGLKLPPNMVKYDITIGDRYHSKYSGGFKKNALKLTLPRNISLGKWIHECVRSVEYCYMMEQVLLWNEEENQTNIHIPLVFPKLKKLELYFLPRLMSFSKGIFQSIEFPLLMKMKVSNCPLLKGLVSSTSSDDHDDDVSNIQFFPKEVCVFTFTSPIGPPHYNDDSMHLFCNANKVEFGNLIELSICDYDSMRNGCGQISMGFFAVLCKLDVSGLKGMKSLFSCSIARNLGNLVELVISDCEEMVKVIEDEEDDALQISLFPNLIHLELWDLYKLKCFCEWRCTLQLPKLQLLIIRCCDVMNEFTLGALDTPNLETIFIDEKDSGNEVNKALQQLREKQLEMRLEGSSSEADSTD